MAERARELIKQYIEPNRHKPGIDEAVIVGTGIPVWALVGYSRGVNGNLAEVAADYLLPLEAVEAAMAYYEQHKAIIDNRMAANDAA